MLIERLTLKLTCLVDKVMERFAVLVIAPIIRVDDWIFAQKYCSSICFICRCTINESSATHWMVRLLLYLVYLLLFLRTIRPQMVVFCCLIASSLLFLSSSIVLKRRIRNINFLYKLFIVKQNKSNIKRLESAQINDIILDQDHNSYHYEKNP